MATINTIQIKRSATTVIPTGLEAGELAYSFAPTGNTLWIGDLNNPGSAIPIGGGNYFYLNNVTPGQWNPFQVVVPDANGDVNFVKTGDLFLNGFHLTSANSVANLTHLGLASNTEIVTSWAIKEYVDLKAFSGAPVTFTTDDGSAVSNATIAVSGNNGIITSGLPGDIIVNLTDTGVVPGTYGNFTVDSTGRITNATPFSSTLRIAGTSGNVDTIDLVNDFMFFAGGNGVTVDTSNKTVTYYVDHDLLPNFVSNEHIDHTTVSILPGIGLTGGGDLTATRTLAINANTAGGISANNDGLFVKTGLGVYLDASGNVAIGQEVFQTSNVTFNDAIFTGNVFIQGTQTIINTEVTTIRDNLVRFASNNAVSDVVDIGFYGEYNSGNGQVFTGLVRDATDGKYKLFKDNPVEPGQTVTPPFTISDLVANITGSTVYNLLQPIAVPDGGTGLNNIAVNSVMIGNGTNPVKTVTGNPYEVFQIDSLGNPIFGIIDCGTWN